MSGDWGNAAHSHTCIFYGPAQGCTELISSCVSGEQLGVWLDVHARQHADVATPAGNDARGSARSPAAACDDRVLMMKAQMYCMQLQTGRNARPGELDTVLPPL